MSERPLGRPLSWTPVASPARGTLHGAHVLLRPIDAGADAEALFTLSHAPRGDPGIWTYLFDGPYETLDSFAGWLADAETSADPLFFTVVDLDGHPRGMAAYMRIVPASGAVEIGHVWFSPQLQRTTAATEAIFLLASHAFDDLGYRRVEWKCNALNAASRRAAERFGFTFEGIFRNHTVVKGRNRDTAWYAITDGDWPPIRAGFRAWLATENFDEAGRQRHSLGELMPTASG